VPCCVFPKLFPHRRVRVDTLQQLQEQEEQEEQEQDTELVPVVRYPEFMAYLQAKDPRLRLAFLDCKGRNAIVYLPLATTRPLDTT
jgi:hypothetical protein